MKAISQALLLITYATLVGCIDSGNRGWDFGAEPDLEGGASLQQAWRGVHEGRIGFRCREGQVLLFVETWHPLTVPAGKRIPMKLSFRFDASSEISDSVDGLATARGIEITADRIGDGAPNSLLRGMGDNADELLATLQGAQHLITIRFDIEDASHAHGYARGDCRRS